MQKKKHVILQSFLMLWFLLLDCKLLEIGNHIFIKQLVLNTNLLLLIYIVVMFIDKNLKK